MLMISVVIPIFNSEAYIDRTLRCFGAQSYKEFELILVDDASTDNSRDIILNRPEHEHLNIRYFRLPQHNGASAARNYGATYAKGELLFFEDSDDIVAPDFLASFLKEYEHTHYDVCFCNYQVLDERNENAEPYEIKNYFTFSNHRSIYFNYLTEKTTLCHCAAAYRRDFLFEKGFRYTESCQCAEDTEFLCKVLFAAEQVSFIDNALYTYCQHSPSLTHSLPDNRILDAYKAVCRAQHAIPYAWRFFFFITKRARIHGFILDMFLQANIPVPQQYCTAAELLICLILNYFFARNTVKHRKVLSAFWAGQIKFNN